MADRQESTWVFGHGSLIWWTDEVVPVERREGILLGWHRAWTWISSSRFGAPTCSLEDGGQVRGVFLRLNLETANVDLEKFRRRENPNTEESITDAPIAGAITYFWTMGDNLGRFPEFDGLSGSRLAQALAERAKRITTPGRDGVLPVDCIRRVHNFDPNDAWTAEIACHL